MSEKNNEYAVSVAGQQVVDLLLRDEDGFCVITSPLESSEKGMHFTTLNEQTGNRYRVTVKIQEI